MAGAAQWGVGGFGWTLAMLDQVMKPTEEISVRDVFGIDTDMRVKGFAERTDRVGHVNDGPVARQQRKREVALGPGHQQEVVAGKQLRPATATRIRPSGEASPPNAGVAAKPSEVSLATSVKMQCAEAGEGIGQDARHEHRPQWQVRLHDALFEAVEAMVTQAA